MFKKIQQSTTRSIAWYVVTYSLYTAVAGSFDIAFTLRLTGSFVLLSFLYLFYYSCLAAVFIFSTMRVASGRYSRGFRLALLFQVLIGALMFFFMPTSEMPWMILVYFMLKGAAEGFFWSTRHAAFSCLTENDNRDSLLLSIQVGTIVIAVTMPFLAGLFMRFTSVRAGYTGIYLAGAVAALFALSAGPSIRLPSANLVRPDLRKFRAFITAPSSRTWRAYMIFGSLNMTLSLFVSAIMNVGVLKTEFNLGMFTSAAAVFAAVFILVVRRRIQGRAKRRIGWVALGSVGDFSGRIVYITFMNVPSLLFKALCDNFLSPLRAIFAENIIRRKSDLMTASGAYSALEPYLFQEIVIFFARSVAFTGIAGVFTVFPLNPQAAARILMTILAFAPILDFFLLKRIEKENFNEISVGSKVDQ